MTNRFNSTFKQKQTIPMRRGKLRSNGVKLAHKRKKRSPREILRDKAWNAFSKWIRARDGRCVTCGSVNNLQAGHRWHGKLDFDEININAQCSGCNKWKQGNLSKYDDYLITKYGMFVWTQLYERKNQAVAEYRTDEDYQALIEKYVV